MPTPPVKRKRLARERDASWLQERKGESGVEGEKRASGVAREFPVGSRIPRQNPNFPRHMGNGRRAVYAVEGAFLVKLTNMIHDLS